MSKQIDEQKLTTISRVRKKLVVSKLQMQTKDPARYAYHKQQCRDRRGIQPDKLTTKKLTNGRLTNLQEPQG